MSSNELHLCHADDANQLFLYDDTKEESQLRKLEQIVFSNLEIRCGYFLWTVHTDFTQH